MLLGTLQRRLQHDSIIGDINWIPIEVGRTKRYTAHERIQKFLQQTALPPAGVLQSSCSVGPRIRVDFLASSDTQLDVAAVPQLGRGTLLPPRVPLLEEALAAISPPRQRWRRPPPPLPPRVLLARESV